MTLAHAAANTPESTYAVSVREARLVVSRLLLTCRLDPGYVPAVTDVILASQALGLGGFGRLAADLDMLQMDLLPQLGITETGADALHIDARGLHAWIAAPTLIDLAVEVADRAGQATLTVTNLRQPEELAVTTALARRHGAQATLSIAQDASQLQCRLGPRPVTAAQWDPWLLQALRHGFASPASTWRALYTLSNRALAPDSVMSRRHAGPVIMLDDGTIAGRIPEDDDFDPRMLREVPASQP